MMRQLILVTILAATALSGCIDEDSGESQDAGGDPTDGADQTSGDGNATDTGSNQTGAPPPAENTPPTANITANATNGSVPLVVAFELVGEDADGDDLSWTFDADGDGETDGNGTELPASFEFTYDESGNYTAVLAVSDGEETASANITISAEVPVVAGPNICHRPGATGYAGTIYTLDEGGNWVFRESNGMAGLQVGNTHATGPDGGGVGFANPAWADCVEGDHMLF